MHFIEKGYRKKTEQDRLNFGVQLKQALEEFTDSFLPHMKEEEEVEARVLEGRGALSYKTGAMIVYGFESDPLNPDIPVRNIPLNTRKPKMITNKHAVWQCIAQLPCAERSTVPGPARLASLTP